MRLHPRASIVQQARFDLQAAITAIVQAHDLTFGEILKLLADSAHDYARLLIRAERHHDLDKKGDEE